MFTRIRNRHLFLSDILLLSVASYGSFLLRLEDYRLEQYGSGFLIFTLLALLVTPAIFYVMRLYSHYWRYASVDDMLLLFGGIVIATTIAASLTLAFSWGTHAHIGIPRSVPFIFLLLAIFATAGPRYAIRLTAQFNRRHRNNGELQPVLIVGAGHAGELIARELQKNARPGMHAVGFIDDDPQKLHARIHGIPVLGNRDQLQSIVQQHAVQQVIIAIPSAPGKTIRALVQLCERAGVKAQTMPAVSELLDGKVSVSKLRNIQIEDLLRRQPVRIDDSAVAELIRGKRVLITGGGGSIGSELCRQVLRFEPASLVILGHGENSVFAIHNELLRQINGGVRSFAAEAMRGLKAQIGGESLAQPCRLDAVIADFRFPERLRAVFAEHRPELVFHAGAHKHVPLMELNPVEAITNNVLGTRNLLDISRATGVQHFVMVSTDKAVNPTSVMGSSKRVAELLVHQAAVASGLPYLVVRFGNVLGSRGSVVLTFKQQIADGGPVTVTHPEMRRYFMTIPEAVQLLLQAATLGHGGEVFVLDMGEPVKIVDLARDMIELSGLEVGRDIDITFTGLRLGEKLYEELFIPGEQYQPTVHEKISIARNASTFVPPQLNEWIRALEIAVQRNDDDAIALVLESLAPHLRAEAENRERPTPAMEPLQVRIVGT